MINSILGDSFVFQVVTQMKSFLKPCKFPTADHKAFSVESVNACVKLHIIPQAIFYQMEFHFSCVSFLRLDKVLYLLQGSKNIWIPPSPLGK